MSGYIELATNGWPVVPGSFAKSLTSLDKEKEAQLSVLIVELPEYEIANRTYAIAREQLPENSFSYSLRVVYLGKARISIQEQHVK